MRINSISLRLNHSSSWSNLVAPGRNYNYNLLSCHAESIKVIKMIVGQEPFLNRLIFGSIFSKALGREKFALEIYTYIPELTENSGTAINITKTGLLQHVDTTVENFFYKNFLESFSTVLNHTLKRVFPKRHYRLQFVFIRKRFFNSYIISQYISSRLKHMFRLTKVANDIIKDLSFNKNLPNVIIYCSGRFDRKERASFNIFSNGKLSLNTISNSVSFSSREVILKYGVCGIKVWTLK